MILFGAKTEALFDVWSLEHLVSGVNLYFLVAYCLARWANTHSETARMGWVMAVCFLWEALEHYLEIGLAGAKVEFWLQGVEFWLNRLLTDPLLIALGAYLARHYSRLNLPAKLFSIAWLLVHIGIFSDSMVLQRMLPEIAL